MINNPDLFNKSKPPGFDGIFDWDFLIPIFEGTKIRPMDFDCVIERNGWFLVIETKPHNKELPIGQKILFKRLSYMNNFSILIVYGKTEATITKIYAINNGQFKEKEETLYQLVEMWWNYANNKKY